MALMGTSGKSKVSALYEPTICAGFRNTGKLGNAAALCTTVAAGW